MGQVSESTCCVHVIAALHDCHCVYHMTFFVCVCVCFDDILTVTRLSLCGVVVLASVC